MRAPLLCTLLFAFAALASCASVSNLQATSNGPLAHFTVDVSGVSARGSIGSCDFGNGDKAVSLAASPQQSYLEFYHVYESAGEYNVKCSGDGFEVSTTVSISGEAKRAPAAAAEEKSESQQKRADPITVITPVTNQQIIDSIFTGSGFTNIRLEVVGNQAAYGLFSGYTTAIPSARQGVVLGSGSVAAIPGTSRSVFVSGGVGSFSEVNNVCQLLGPGHSYYDGTLLKFTYDNPSKNGISIQFTFFSEDYPPFADGIAIVSNGQQIAFDSNHQPVNVNGEFFNNVAAWGDEVGIVIDKGTQPLVATGPLTPGSVDNTLYIAVADADDGGWDCFGFISGIIPCIGDCDAGTVVSSPIIISQIPELDENVCSPAVQLSNIPAGEALTLSTIDTMSPCTAYADAGCNSAFDLAFSGDTRTVYFKCQSSWFQNLKATTASATATSNAFQVVGHSGGDICGDPHFVGYDGTKFDFNGKIGSYYNIYTDSHLSLNSLFISAGAANPYMADATVNGLMALRTRDFNVTLDPKDYSKETLSVSFTFNGEKLTIKEGEQMMMNGGCAKITFQQDHHVRHHHHTLTVMTQKFKVYAHLAVDNNIYVNATYLDYFVSADLAHPTQLGGILGDSAGNKNADEIANDQDAYLVADMFSVLPVYGDEPVCRGASIKTQKRALDAPTCNTVPDGHKCFKHRTCSSGVCGNTNVCHPWGACFVDIDCFGQGTCNSSGQCVSV